MNVSLEAIGTEPVTTALAKTWLRLDTSDHDTEVGELITAGRDWFETLTGYLVEQRAVTLELDSWEIKTYHYLPYGPIQSVTSIKIWDDSASDWGSDIKSGTNRITRTNPPRLEQIGTGWPTEVAHKALQIVYEAGATAPKEALYIIKEWIVRAYDAAGEPFDVADLESRATRFMMNPLGVVR